MAAGLHSRLHSLIDATYQHAVTIRRDIHEHPELSGKEFRTARTVFDALRGLGLNPKYYVNKTGVAASLGKKKGPTVVLRADMDALPLTEENQVPFRSKVDGVMHACGHDMHTAILLGATTVLRKLEDELDGQVVVLFQPSEEVEPGGAIQLIREKAFPAHAKAVFGLHVSADHPVGSIGLHAGSECTGVLAFDVLVKGRGGHGAMPETTIDPIVCAASMIMELQTLISREYPPFEPAVLTVGTFAAGTKRNIIPDQAHFQGTIRTFSVELQKGLRRRVSEMLKAIASSYRAQAEIGFIEGYPPGYNDPSLTVWFTEHLSTAVGKRAVITRSAPVMFAEDFAYYQQKAPGVFVHLGVRPKGKQQVPGIHSSRFLPDEEAMKTGMLAHCLFAIEQLAAK